MTDEDLVKKKREAVEQILGKPFAAAMSDATEKIRRNLMVASCLTIAIVILGVRVSQTNTLLGISFDGLTADTLKKGLLAVNIYMLVHFLWCMLDELQEWRLRITGTRSAYITGGTFGSEDADYPSEPRQSTLHNWWQKVSMRFPQTEEAISRLDGALDRLLETEEVKRNSGQIQPVSNAGVLLQQIKSDMTTLLSELNLAKAVIESPRVCVSLERFDKAYELFLRSQNLRWLVVEAGFPVLLGGASLWLLVRDLYCGP
ncbi:hypothetical protein [Variovorax paradoxus]|nr:hypothetical protein [Variovorax paradoxus]